MQENIELVRAIFDGWAERGVEGMLPFFAEDIDYLPLEEDSTITGHAAMRRYFERWMEPWEQFEIKPTEFRVTGNRVLNGAAMKGQGQGSGIEIAMEYWQVWLIRDGKALRCEEYLDHKDALAALGQRG